MGSLRVTNVWEQPEDAEAAGVDGLSREGHIGH